MNKTFIRCCLSLFIAWVSASAAEQTAAPQVDLTGAWSFSSNNTYNDATIFQVGVVISGGYLNDSRDRCAIAGRAGVTPNKVSFVIVCPRGDIQYNGDIVNPNLITGRYKAYGDSAGEFKMSRQ